MTDSNIVKVMVTGHRPNRLCGSYAQNHPVRCNLRSFFDAALSDLKRYYEKTEFKLEVISGLALGVDSDFASVALNQNIPLHAYIAGPWQASRWSQTDRLLFQRFLSEAKTVWTAESHYDVPRPVLYIKRDHKMALDCSSAFAIFDGVENGGTFETIKMLEKYNKPVVKYSVFDVENLLNKHKVISVAV